MSRGNRCGHQLTAPRYFVPPSAHKTRPGILVRLGERVRSYYDTPESTLPSLNACNGSNRQQRSERREACLLVLGALIHYLDLMTLRVGIPKADGRFQGLTVEFLAERTGLCQRRVERASRDLVRARLISVHPIAIDEGGGRYSGRAAIRAVTDRLFVIFGLQNWLKHERQRASNLHRRYRRQAMKREQAQREMVTRPLFRRRAKPPGHDHNPTQDLIDLLNQHPDIPIVTAFDLVKRRPNTTGNPSA